jgi:hypothetical protein
MTFCIDENSTCNRVTKVRSVVASSPNRSSSRVSFSNSTHPQQGCEHLSLSFRPLPIGSSCRHSSPTMVKFPFASGGMLSIVRIGGPGASSQAHVSVRPAPSIASQRI